MAQLNDDLDDVKSTLKEDVQELYMRVAELKNQQSKHIEQSNRPVNQSYSEPETKVVAEKADFDYTEVERRIQFVRNENADLKKSVSDLLHLDLNRRLQNVEQ